MCSLQVYDLTCEKLLFDAPIRNTEDFLSRRSVQHVPEVA